MIRILHLTDFHLNKKTLKDWDDFYKDAFFNKLDEIKNEQQIDLVFFTGDLIDRAGKDFGSVTKGLNKFRESIIYPILKELNLDISRFIICPGNHDVDRNADKGFFEAGLKSSLNNIDSINSFMDGKDSDYDGIQRIKEYKNFEFDLYKSINQNKLHSKFKFSLKLNINGKTVGISSINSAWRCFGDDDFKNILIGENQLNDNYIFIKDCDYKIALVHHQLEWLSEIESNTIKNHFSANYDLTFSGHVHEANTEFVKTLTGSSIRIISPSGLNQIRQDNINYSNGFSIIDYGEIFKGHYFKYNHMQKAFVDNTDVSDKGIFEINLASLVGIPRDNHNLLIEDDFLSFLNDSGANFTHRSKNLSLDDIYVNPFLEQFSLIEQETKNASIPLDQVFDKITSNEISHLVFLGEENSGKTSLCKRLYKRLLSTEKVLPIYIKGRDIKRVADQDIENLINKECRKQYKNDCSSLDFRKTIIIDDFNNCSLPQKSKRNFINYLYKTEFQTIITWDEFFTLGDLLESQTINVEIYEVLKFGTKKRLELIRKWIDLIDDEFQDNAEKEFHVNQLLKIVNSVIGKNLVPSLPIYILTILQANELTTNTNFEQSTFGHYYDVLIKSAIGQRIKDNKEIEKYYSYLSELSYRMFYTGAIELNEDTIMDFHRFFISQYKLQIGFRDTIEALEKCNLILQINNSYKFKYKYIYFYFIGKYLSDNIEDHNVQKIVKELSHKLYQTESANIFIFLSHHSKSKFIINEILKRAEELFDNQTIIGFNKDIEHINSLIDEVTEKIDFDVAKSIDEHKNDEYTNDEYTNDEHTNKNANDNNEIDSIDSISKINKAFKTIEILGYIIKNRYASLKGSDKDKLVEELYKLGLRSLAFIFKTLLDGEEYIKNEIIDIIRKDPNSTLTTSEREGLAKQVIFNLLYMISYSIFKRISTSISSKDLELTFKDVKARLSSGNPSEKNNAVLLIDMSIVFEYSKKFPETNIEELVKEFKNNKLAFAILRRLGINFMRMIPMKESEQQKAGELLQISMKNQRVIGGTSKIAKQ
ncbi:metallophosphoesterase [Flavobacterium lindanitolerans]|uniref:metallophosphoesterase n=1 Tax=Flavobacterium lindanitolerans TaxID=428988 RepID=UPI002809611D|nr:metallophosphoesterase [Flavobacterium lindanitolerans]MDQ7959642.1 metallophosphoesterase [Flavobacterium lindanitolerans]